MNKPMFPEQIKEDLYHCLKCGMCQQVCPTFKLTRQEYYAPRGRVQLIKHYLEGDLGISPNLAHALSSCILCDACAALCPSGVRIDRLLRNMRLDLDEAVGQTLDKKLLFALLRKTSRLRRAAGVVRFGQKLLVDGLGTSRKLGNSGLVKLPPLQGKPFRERAGELVSPKGKPAGRVVYFTGCATDLVYGDVGEAVLKVLANLGIEVLIPRDQVCCSAPIFLSGAAKEALPNIFRNLDVLDSADADAIVVDCATCGSALKKEIPELLEDLGLDTEKARRVAKRVKDVTQIVAERLDDLEIQPSMSSDPLVVTYHDPCHLGRGMGVTAEPRKILQALGNVRFVEMEGANECCGGGGSYQFDNVELSGGITSRKTDHIHDTRARIVTTGCPGCRLTLGCNMRDEDNIEVLHTVQLLARHLPE